MAHGRTTIPPVDGPVLVPGLLVLALALSAAPSHAHDLGLAQLDLGVAGSRLEAHAIYSVRARVDPLHWVNKEVAVEVDGASCTGSLDRTETNDQDFEIWATYACPDAPGTVSVTVYELGRGAQLVARIHAGDKSTQAVLTAEKRQLSLEVTPPSQAPPRRWPWAAALAILVTLIIVTLHLRTRARPKADQ
jgi:hypothetical protein